MPIAFDIPAMTTLPFCGLSELAAAIPDGAKLAVPNDPFGVAIAATRAIVRRGARRLHVVCLPTSGIQADVLIGAGCVATIETSAVALGEHGTAPRFAQAVRDRGGECGEVADCVHGAAPIGKAL